MNASNIHDDIEPWLAASVHDQLSPEERSAFEEHLAACPSCRGLHQEQTAMSKMIENALASDRPDFGFEQRAVSRFRKVVPEKAGFSTLLTGLLRARATQLTAVAAVLFSLVMVGRWLTDESWTLGNEEILAPRRGSLNELGSNFAGGERKALAAKPKAEPAHSLNRKETGNRSRDSVASQTRGMTNFATTTTAPSPPEAEPDVVAPPEQPEFMEEKPADSLETAATLSEALADEPGSAVPAADANRKLVRNAQVELEIVKFDEAVQKITVFAAEDRGYIATSSSQKQANGKLHGDVVVKVLPEKLDGFLLKLRGLGELKNQTLGSEDVTKQYFDTDSRLKNARVMEQRLIDILKTKSSKVADLLEVEKELGRVRAQIEEMQGALKYMDAQVQFATVTITLAEKEMNLPAAFLLKRTAQLALFSNEVEKTFADAKAAVDGTQAQISSSTLDRDSTGKATARLVLLIVPEEADALIARIKGMGRVQNYTEQTNRIAQGGGTGMSDAKVERDKAQLSITISRNEQEPALQTTSLRILTSGVNDKVVRLKENAAKAGAEIRSSSFSRDPDGQEIASITLRVAMKNYASLLGSFDQLGKVKDVSVQREDRRGTVDEQTAPADINIEVYSQGRIVGDETGLFATIRRTLAQGASALMWSLRMIGVALAFLAPWALAVAAVAWVLRRIARRRAAAAEAQDSSEQNTSHKPTDE